VVEHSIRNRTVVSSNLIIGFEKRRAKSLIHKEYSDRRHADRFTAVGALWGTLGLFG
jgi:hypothetical protein